MDDEKGWSKGPFETFQLGADMKKYTIRRHGNRFKIHEKSTGLYVASSTKQHRAKTVANSLENGGGFDGSTPTFMLTGLRFGIDLDRQNRNPHGCSRLN